MKKNFGFTLIEILVVVSIIGVLASLAMVSYSGAQKQTRDSQRKSDLNQYRNALEAFSIAYNDKYPARVKSWGQPAADENFLCGDLGTEFLPSCPADPINQGRYIYMYRSGGPGTQAGGSATATFYVLWVGLETGDVWVICSNGRIFKLDHGPSNADCGF